MQKLVGVVEKFLVMCLNLYTGTLRYANDS